MRTLTAFVLLAAVLALPAAQAAEIGKIANDPIPDTGNVFVSSTVTLNKNSVYYLVKGGTVVAQLKPVTIVKGVGGVMQINPKTAIGQVRVGDVVIDSAGEAAPAPGVAAPPVAPVAPMTPPSVPAAPFTPQTATPPSPFVVPGQVPPPQAPPPQAPAPVDTGSPFVVQPSMPAPPTGIEATAPIAPAPPSTDSPFVSSETQQPRATTPFVQQPGTTAPPTGVAPAPSDSPFVTGVPPTEDSPFITSGQASGFGPTGMQGIETTPPIPPLLD